MFWIESTVEGPHGIGITYVGYHTSALSPTVRVRCRVIERQDDCVRVRPETALPASVWVHASDVEIWEGESKNGWLNCFLDEIADGWVYITLPTDNNWRRVVTPYGSVARVESSVKALASG